ncbi:MAG: hypothetical protein Q9168_006811 [Polycauliona sp. 1 TL-2023]
MLSSKLYVVNSVDLISSIQRLPKALAWPPIVSRIAGAFCGSSEEARAIFGGHDKGDWPYFDEMHKTMQSALAPGPGLDGMNRVMIENISRSVDKLQPQRHHGKVVIGLEEWTRHEITMATTNSTYGEHNPFRDQAIEKAFWDFEDGLVMLIINRLPHWTARKAHEGREAATHAFREYFQAEHHKTASLLMRERYDLNIGNCVGILVNTAPAAFWTLFNVYSRADVLEECRREIDILGSAMTTGSLDRQTRKTVDIAMIKQNCPILTSTLQETLRQYTLGVAARRVMHETLLDGSYLLEKDATIIIPSRAVHTDPAVWGPDASDFDYKRFMRDYPSALNPSQPKPKSTAFRAFGGGTSLCPGRHFATTEILSTVVMLLLRYDLVPIGGKWPALKTANSNMAAIIMKPDTDVQVEVVARKGTTDCEWDFKLAE